MRVELTLPAWKAVTRHRVSRIKLCWWPEMIPACSYRDRFTNASYRGHLPLLPSTSLRISLRTHQHNCALLSVSGPSRTGQCACVLALDSHTALAWVRAIGILLHALGYRARCIPIQCCYCIKLLMFRKTYFINIQTIASTAILSIVPNIWGKASSQSRTGGNDIFLGIIFRHR